MAKAFEPPICKDCKYLVVTGDGTMRLNHECHRLRKMGKDLVTGEESMQGVFLLCYEERNKTGEANCGKIGRFFKEK